MNQQEDARQFAERRGIFLKNRQAFPLEELAKYGGQWIAWSPDGTRILASSSASEEAVYEQVAAGEYDPATCCLSYVPAPDDLILGALWAIKFPGPNEPSQEHRADTLP